MNICLECGYVFDDKQIAHWEEMRGEFWGRPAYEKMSGCPRCLGDYKEAEKCEECGKYVLAVNENKVCDSCKEIKE